MTGRARAALIAVVDDDPSVLESLGMLLESAGHAVRLFSSSEALLENGWLAQIDCLISDLAMPGMDGVELVRRAVAARPRLPIILITGQADRPNASLSVGAGVYRVFKKPFHGPELLAAVSEALR